MGKSLAQRAKTSLTFIGAMTSLSLLAGLVVARRSGAEAAGPEVEAEPPSLRHSATQTTKDSDTRATTPTEQGTAPILEVPRTHPEATRMNVRRAASELQSAWCDRTGKTLRPRGLSILLAHWALETGRGEKMVGHNFGGLKGRSKDGQSIVLWTREREGDGYVLVERRFRAYDSSRAGALDYVELLDTRYSLAFQAVRDGEVDVFVKELEEAGYFTDDAETYRRAMRSLWYEFMTSGVLDGLEPS